jgi:hypothetical protein
MRSLTNTNFSCKAGEGRVEYGRRSCHGVRPKPYQTLIGVTGALDPRGCEQRWEYRRSTRIRQGLTNETIPVDGGLYDVVIDGITDILKSVQGEKKAVSNAKQPIDIFLQDLGLGRN